MTAGWQVFLDRGGTFTDAVAISPAGERCLLKVLSDDGTGRDPSVRAILTLAGEDPVTVVKMGTTVATNALLERRGVPTCLAITSGFEDALKIGDQSRPELFALEVTKPAPLAAATVGIPERSLHDGTVRRPLDRAEVERLLAEARDAGCRSLSVVLVHGALHPEHEREVESLARAAGFEHVSLSHEVAPGLGLVARGDTTTVDAYLTPLLAGHVRSLRRSLGDGPRIRFMQSSGGLVDAGSFRGRDAVLSGPAGGVVALARVAERSGFSAVIGFDMGGTSTDVSRWSRADGFERVPERQVAGVLLRAPTMDIATVAAGGGSILATDGRRFTVGPESAGASPGPACHRAGGPATVTDANVVLGRVQPRWFPRCFGPGGDQPIDVEASRERLAELGAPFGLSPEEAAAGFIQVANECTARAIRELSVARGRDVRDHALACFGGAGPQHACSLANSLGVDAVLLHPLAGVFSAWGMGLADLRRSRAVPILAPLEPMAIERLERERCEAAEELRAVLIAEGVPAESVRCDVAVELRRVGVEHALSVSVDSEIFQGAESAVAELRAAFDDQHRRLFGHVEDGPSLEIVALRVEAIGPADAPEDPSLASAVGPVDVVARVDVWFDELDAPSGHRAVERHETPVVLRAALRSGHEIAGPALVMDDVSTIVIEPGWDARVLNDGTLHLSRQGAPHRERTSTARDPVQLEVFGNRFMSVAEQMGQVLARVAHSTNIKERRDFSCAVFDGAGRLVANAPHVPVHLGAMGETVRALMEARGRTGFEPGMVLASNDPYRGGSHLPDVTVVTPVFDSGDSPAWFVANRGHHSDVGGVRPGSMPPSSSRIEEEGVVFHDLTLVQGGRFLEGQVVARLSGGPLPVRDVRERLSDLRAQVAANAAGVRLLEELAASHGADVISAYMRHVQDDASEATAEALARLPAGAHAFEDQLDDGSRLAVTVTVLDGRARFDFAGTSPQHAGNLNAPRAVVTAAVLYVLRCLVARPIPLNAGCLDPIDIVVPGGSLLDPTPPAAVVGGNVETSQRIVDVVLGALGVAAASQGTMNNVTFGTERFGYYETICGGTGAGPGFAGAAAVHSHMTNTLITDVEVLERRHPVVLREFAIRRGSGGAGRWDGGDGVVRAIEFLERMSADVLSERRETAPFGLAGGSAGARGSNRLLRADGTEVRLGGRAEVEVGPGDVLVIETPGGGGYGESGASADAGEGAPTNRTDHRR